MNDLVNLKLKGNIYLIGFMAAGKSKVGQLLAAKLEWNYIDTDTEIEKQAGLTITEIFEVKGESLFRTLESEVIDRVSKLDKHVISLGGGAIMDETNWQKIFHSGKTIRIKASPKVILARTFGKKNRPLLNGLSKQQHHEKIKEMLLKREPYYARADIHVTSTNNNPPAFVVNQILEQLKDHA